MRTHLYLTVLIASCSLGLSSLHTPATAGSRHHAPRIVKQHTAPPAADTGTTSWFGGSLLVDEARKYIGTNPTGRGSLWCGAFMDLVLRRTGHPGGGNLAWGYEHYGHRVARPEVGAIAIMGRRGGGHVGVVSGIDANGNPVIISGNTWSRESHGKHVVLEGTYPRSRIAAYVMPDK